jgi:hypothetical protein
MDAELIALVNSGATTLLGLMVTDAWGRSKRAIASLVGAGGEVDRALESDLEDTRVRLLAAIDEGDLAAEADLAAEWRSRLRRAVENDSLAVDALERFVEQNKAAESSYNNQTDRMIMKARASGNSRIFQQGQGVQHNR